MRSGRAPCAIRLPGAGRPEAASSRRLDRDDVAGRELGARLRRQLRAVQQAPPGRARLAATGATRLVRAPLGEDREPAVLEHPQLADDAVSPAPPPATPGVGAERVAL